MLADELLALGCEQVQTAGAGVRFVGSITTGYMVCLWSRVANRVLLPIHRGDAASPEQLYELAQEIDWYEHVDTHGTLAVDFLTANSTITHSRYGALKVKDAIVDQFRSRWGHRPDVERETPDLRVNVYLFRNKARFSIDLSGRSLHRRGYRTAGGLAPLKENLAAAILLAARWPEFLAQGRPLFDPLCGSGTLLIEAAMMACDQAPGLHRDYFGFAGWKQHDEEAWSQLLGEAKLRISPAQVTIVGADQNETVIEACRSNIEAAGLADMVEVDQGALSHGRPSSLQSFETGIVVSNPPYGERMATDPSFYAALGSALSRSCAGWHCALFTAESAPFYRTGLPLHDHLKVQNGGIDCVLLTADIPAAAALHPSAHDGITESAPRVLVDPQPFANRLKKNQRALKGWIKQNDIQAYRVYDADLPEFAVAIDLYIAEELHCVVQEYKAPATVNVVMAEARLAAVMSVLPEVLGIDSECIHLKVREVKSGHDQYEKMQHRSGSVQARVIENGGTFEVNFTDYLDVGLFLDHRPVRKYINQNAAGKRFLNLFSYTASATVAAVIGGATSSVSVDSSNRYSQWARRNLDMNNAAAHAHEVVRQDVVGWLAQAKLALQSDKHFDIILLDPPTFSNSSDLDEDWNVQRDHVSVIEACLDVLAVDGLLIFSTNYRRFKLDSSLQDNTARSLRIEDRSRWSIDRDFQRNQRIHQCWFIYK